MTTRTLIQCSIIIDPPYPNLLSLVPQRPTVELHRHCLFSLSHDGCWVSVGQTYRFRFSFMRPVFRAIEGQEIRYDSRQY